MYNCLCSNDATAQLSATTRVLPIILNIFILFNRVNKLSLKKKKEIKLKVSEFSI